MEVAFNVAWGPLSQIAVPLIDIKSTVELAVGAYGWWKARERSWSLIETISANGGQLAPSLSFVLPRYLAACERSEFRGIAWFDGRLESVCLPKASTSAKGDAGLLCLRAVTIALLALYDVEATSAVLVHIIPRYLTNYNLQDGNIEVDGPFIACVRHFVKSIGAEEQCSTLRQNLHGRVDEKYHKMFSESTGKFRHNGVQEIDIPLIIGFLAWILASPSKRGNNRYSTRSQTVWALGVMLAHLGFEVRPSPILIYSKQLYEDIVCSDARTFLLEAFLVVYNGPETDSWAAKSPMSRSNGSFATRVVPIRTIPTIIFRNVCHVNENKVIDVEKLCKVWGDAFDHVYSVIGSPQLDLTTTLVPSRQTNENDSVTIKSSSIVPRVTGLQNLVHKKGVGTPPPRFPDNAALFQILASPLSKYLPDYCWTRQLLCKELGNYYWQLHAGPNEAESPFSEYTSSLFAEKTEHWYTFVAIVLATAYATCCKSLHTISDVGAPAGSLTWPSNPIC
jgi:hypothetical protein